MIYRTSGLPHEQSHLSETNHVQGIAGTEMQPVK